MAVAGNKGIIIVIYFLSRKNYYHPLYHSLRIQEDLILVQPTHVLALAIPHCRGLFELSNAEEIPFVTTLQLHSLSQLPSNQEPLSQIIQLPTNA